MILAKETKIMDGTNEMIDGFNMNDQILIISTIFENEITRTLRKIKIPVRLFGEINNILISTKLKDDNDCVLIFIMKK